MCVPNAIFLRREVSFKILHITLCGILCPTTDNTNREDNALMPALNKMHTVCVPFFLSYRYYAASFLQYDASNDTAWVYDHFPAKIIAIGKGLHKIRLKLQRGCSFVAWVRVLSFITNLATNLDARNSVWHLQTKKESILLYIMCVSTCRMR